MAIAIRKPSEINNLALSGKIVAQAINYAKSLIREGVSLLEIDQAVEEFIFSCDARPAFKGLYGFPNSACISVNSVVIHGIPTSYKLQKGDIVGIDVGVEKNGWYGDAAITVGVGQLSSEDESLISCAYQTLIDIIGEIKVGMHFKEVSFLLGESIKAYGFVPLRDYCGHGIGRRPHEEPQIPNYLSGGSARSGEKIKEGMVFCLEPMVCQKSGDPVILADGWSVVSKDGLNTSHYEHTVAIIGGRAEILSKEE